MSESDVSDSKHEECGAPGPGLGEARVRGVGVVGLGGEVGGHVGWEGVAVAHKLLLVLRLRLAVSRPGVPQVAGAGS